MINKDQQNQQNQQNINNIYHMIDKLNSMLDGLGFMAKTRAKMCIEELDVLIGYIEEFGDL